MAFDFFSNEISVGDFVVYAVNRDSLNYGLVLDITERNRGNWVESSFKVVRVSDDGREVYDNNIDGLVTVPPTCFKVKTSITTNTGAMVIIPEEKLRTSEELLKYKLWEYKDRILRGEKIFKI